MCAPLSAVEAGRRRRMVSGRRPGGRLERPLMLANKRWVITGDVLASIYRRPVNSAESEPVASSCRHRRKRAAMRCK